MSEPKTNVEKLREWGEKERVENGLVDIHFFPGTSNEVTVEEAAGVVLDAVTSDDVIDITNEPL